MGGEDKSRYWERELPMNSANVLVVGSGEEEHALVWKLNRGRRTAQSLLRSRQRGHPEQHSDQYGQILRPSQIRPAERLLHGG